MNAPRSPFGPTELAILQGERLQLWGPRPLGAAMGSSGYQSSASRLDGSACARPEGRRLALSPPADNEVDLGASR